MVSQRKGESFDDYRRRDAARHRAKYDSKERPTSCLDCNGDIVQPTRGRRLRCDACNQARPHPAGKRPLRPTYLTIRCAGCDSAINSGRFNKRRYCDECARNRHFYMRIGRCLIFPKSCSWCTQAFIARVSWQTYCSAACSSSAYRAKNRARLNDYAREWQRRTRKTAINYWRIANTLEALELAKTYYQLRRLLRKERSGHEEKGHRSEHRRVAGHAE